MVISEYKYFRKIGFSRVESATHCLQMVWLRIDYALSVFIARFKKPDDVTNDDYGC